MDQFIGPIQQHLERTSSNEFEPVQPFLYKFLWPTGEFDNTRFIYISPLPQLFIHGPEQ